MRVIGKKQVAVLLMAVIIGGLFAGCKPIIPSQYTKEQATQLMQEYIKDKYGESTEFEYVEYYADTSNKAINSMGYYGKTKSGYYVRLTDFKDEERTDIRDTKQFPEIEQGLKDYFADNAISDRYLVSLEKPEEKDRQENPDVFWQSLWRGYPLQAKYEGETITKFFRKANSLPFAYYYKDDGIIPRVIVVFFPTKEITDVDFGVELLKAAQELSEEVNGILADNDTYGSALTPMDYRAAKTPYISRAIKKYSGFSCLSTVTAGESIALTNRVSIASPLYGKPIGTMTWELESLPRSAAAARWVEDSMKGDELLTDGFSISCSDQEFYGPICLSWDISDLLPEGEVPVGYSLVAVSDYGDGYIVNSVVPLDGSDKNALVVNGRLLFSFAFSTEHFATYYFLAKTEA